MRRLIVAAPVLALVSSAAPARAQDPSSETIPGMQFPWSHMPEISRRAGPLGGVMVMGPRVISDGTPQSDGAIEYVQARMEAIAGRVSPAEIPYRLRPDAQRTCQEDGCRATTLSALVTSVGGGCAVVAVIGSPGTGPAHLVPWAGDVRLTRTTLAFREPPESVTTVYDLVPCADIAGRLDDARVEAAMRDVLVGRAPMATPVAPAPAAPVPTPAPVSAPDDDASPWG